MGVIEQGLGLAVNALGIGNKRNDKRQITQQQKLTDIQAEANRKQAEYEQQLGMQMWKDTNFSAQKAEMEKAGLSIAGMYSGAGGGGTAGGASVAGVGGAQASDSAQTQQAQTAMGMQMAQLALLGAQKENIEADTENKKAGAGKDTASTEGIQQENKIKTIQAENTEALKEELRDAMLGEIKEKVVKGVVADQTEQEQIKNAKLQNEKIVNEIAQKWNELELKNKGLEIEQQNANVNKFKEEIKANYPAVWDIAGKVIDNVLEKSYEMIKGKKKESTYKIQ